MKKLYAALMTAFDETLMSKAHAKWCATILTSINLMGYM